jgi:hypothetical protein
MIHKASEHRNLPAKHFLTGPNATRRDQAFSDCRIQARSALYCRAPGIVEELCPLTATAFSVSLRRVEQNRQAGPIELVEQFSATRQSRTRDLKEEIGEPCYKLSSI